VFSVISKSSSSSSSSFSVGRAVSQDGIALDGKGNPREFRLALTARTTAENDDEKDWEMTLNTYVPEGRSKSSQSQGDLSSKLSPPCRFRSVQSSRWDGAILSPDSRHFVPGYYRAVPPGQSHSTSKGLALSAIDRSLCDRPRTRARPRTRISSSRGPIRPPEGASENVVHPFIICARPRNQGAISSYADTPLRFCYDPAGFLSAPFSGCASGPGGVLAAPFLMLSSSTSKTRVDPGAISSPAPSSP